MPVKFTPIRVVCRNTLTLALGRGRTWRARHDGDLRTGLQDVGRAMGLIRDEYARIEEAFGALAAILGAAGSLWAAYNAGTELVDHGCGTPVGPRAAANGRLAAAGAAVRPPSPERRLQSCWFGAGSHAKLRAWDAAIAMANPR